MTLRYTSDKEIYYKLKIELFKIMLMKYLSVNYLMEDVGGGDLLEYK